MFFISAKNNAGLFFAWDPRALLGGGLLAFGGLGATGFWLFVKAAPNVSAGQGCRSAFAVCFLLKIQTCRSSNPPQQTRSGIPIRFEFRVGLNISGLLSQRSVRVLWSPETFA